MKNRSVHILVGLFVLLGLAAIVYLSIQVGGGRRAQGGGFEIKARFADVGGLRAGTSVMISGVRVGTVTEVGLSEEDFSAIVEMTIDSDLVLEDDTIASIRSRGLLGESYLALSPGGSGFVLEPGDMIIDTEPAIDLGSLIGQFAFGALDKDDDQDDEVQPDAEEDVQEQ